MSNVAQTIADYYSNLLIMQYHDQPKAKATIALFSRVMFPINSETGNLLISDVRDAYNIDTARGKQLDVIGKYVGLSRPFVVQTLSGYFGFCTYEGLPVGDVNGFTDYTDGYTKTGKTLTYADIVSLSNLANDDDYRTLLKLKIIQNTSNHSLKAIDDELYKYFETDIYISGYTDLEVQYTVKKTYNTIIQIAIQLGVIPRPMGVKATYIGE